MRRVMVSVLVLSMGASGCCFTPTPAPIPPPPGLSPTPLIPPMPVTPAMPGLITLTAGTGMTPDPAITLGVAGGPIAASSLSPACYVGSYPAQPQITVRVATPMPMMVLIAASDADLTLAVRRPDGSFICDDDGDVGVNPRIAEPAVPGDYTVYVGTFGGGVPSPFTFGVTSLPAMAAPLLTDGAVLRRGHLSVLTSTGPSMVMPGTLCDYLQVAHAPSAPGGVDVRWRVVCNGIALYGNGPSEGDAGFSFAANAEWPAGTLVRDLETSAIDTDPSFVWDGSGIRIADDANGWSGAHDTTFVEVP